MIPPFPDQPPQVPLNRRAALQRLCLGFGGLAANSLLADQSSSLGKPHFAPKAKRIIFLFMHGGPSHVDLFDYKPRLIAESGNDLPFAERSVQFKTG
jgi:hypothetical protein